MSYGFIAKNNDNIVVLNENTEVLQINPASVTQTRTTGTSASSTFDLPRSAKSFPMFQITAAMTQITLLAGVGLRNSDPLASGLGVPYRTIINYSSTAPTTLNVRQLTLSSELPNSGFVNSDTHGLILYREDGQRAFDSRHNLVQHDGVYSPVPDVDMTILSGTWICPLLWLDCEFSPSAAYIYGRLNRQTTTTWRSNVANFYSYTGDPEVAAQPIGTFLLLNSL